MIDLTITYIDDTTKKYRLDHVPQTIMDELRSVSKEIKNIHAEFSSDQETLSGNVYTDLMERDFKSLDQLAVHLGLA